MTAAARGGGEKSLPQLLDSGFSGTICTTGLIDIHCRLLSIKGLTHTWMTSHNKHFPAHPSGTKRYKAVMPADKAEKRLLIKLTHAAAFCE